MLPARVLAAAILSPSGETRKPWKDGQEIRGYMRADKMLTRKKLEACPPQIQETLKLVGGVEKSKTYTGYVRIIAECRYVTQALGAFPRKHAEHGDVVAFEKDEAGRFIVPAYCLRAMMARTMPLLGKEQVIAYRIAFRTCHIEVPKPQFFTAPIIDERGNGCGINTYEAIPAGQCFVIDAIVPTSHLAEVDYIEALRLAGSFVRLSPARSTAWGEFEVLSVKEG